MAEHHPLHVATAGERDIDIRREFDAPAQAVFDAYTKPELLRRWFGPPGFQLVECDVDLRVGGEYRYVVRGDDGSEMILRGVHRVIEEPRLLVVTEVLGDEYIEDDASLVTAEFVESDGRTTLTMTVHYPTAEVRDEMARSGMAEGMSGGYDRLDDLLADVVGGR